MSDLKPALDAGVASAIGRRPRRQAGCWLVRLRADQPGYTPEVGCRQTASPAGQLAPGMPCGVHWQAPPKATPPRRLSELMLAHPCQGQQSCRYGVPAVQSALLH